jgi:hypothetical protein
MPLFMDHHKGVEGLSAEAVAQAHRKDMEIQDHYGVKYHRRFAFRGRRYVDAYSMARVTD